MQSAKVSFDFADRPKLVEMLRVFAAQAGRSQKDVVSEALEIYFANHAESDLILRLAASTFADWDNPEDEIYNTL